MDTQHYTTGSVVLGRYVIDSLMGEGGMGQVYAAHHAELGRKRFAIKTLRPELFGMGGIDERFRREADVLASLNHPGIVSIVDYGIENGRTPIMVMELLEGETIRDRLGREGPLPLGEVVRILREVGAALDYTHACTPPIIHRDLKPENLFLTRPDGRVKVLDFGIAKVAGLDSHLTQTASALGTPQYMSPEQLRDAKKVDITTDVFALASIAYELLTGQLAFPGEGIGGVVLAIFDGRRPRPSVLRPEVPPSVDAVLDRAWSIDPSLRFRTAGELASAIAEALGPSPVAAPPGAMPPTRMMGAMAPVATSTPSPAVFSSPTAPTNAFVRKPSRAPLIIGLGVAALAVAAGGLFAIGHAGNGIAGSSGGSTASVTPTNPGGSGASAIAPEPVIGGGAGSSAAADAGAGSLANVLAEGTRTAPPAAPRSPFDVLHDQFERALPGCAASVRRPARVTIEVTWNGSIGLPVHSAYTPSSLRDCMNPVMLQYGQIVPQAQPLVTRRFVYELR